MSLLAVRLEMAALPDQGGWRPLTAGIPKILDQKRLHSSARAAGARTTARRER